MGVNQMIVNGKKNVAAFQIPNHQPNLIAAEYSSFVMCPAISRDLDIARSGGHQASFFPVV